jgi:alcohol dehydrogenase class IV
MSSSQFEFSTATQILFGPGTISEAGRLAKAWGRRAVVVVGHRPQRVQKLMDELTAARISTTTVAITHEPTVDDIVSGAATARRYGAEMVIGMGGGSVMDAAKAISALLTNEDSIFDYLEVVGKGNPLELPPVPWMAIPTTSGTGAEVTRNAVLTIPERGVKVSLRSPYLLARVALIDPSLTLDMPPALTASTGLDALSQLIEAYVSNKANPLCDTLCSTGIPSAAHALPIAFSQPADLTARSDMSLASLYSGMALANAGLGAVHGLASPLGGLFHAPHGALCGALLAPVMAANIKALRNRQPDSPALSRYTDVARWLTRRSDAEAEDGVSWIKQLTGTLAIPPLTAMKVSADKFSVIVEKSLGSSSMKGNPIELSSVELQSVLEAAK